MKINNTCFIFFYWYTLMLIMQEPIWHHLCLDLKKKRIFHIICSSLCLLQPFKLQKQAVKIAIIQNGKFTQSTVNILQEVL